LKLTKYELESLN